MKVLFARENFFAAARSGVAQICNLLYRRIAFRGTSYFPDASDLAAASGLQIRDTAEYNSALLRLRRQPRCVHPWLMISSRLCTAIPGNHRVPRRFCRSADSLVRLFPPNGGLRADKAVRAPLVAAQPRHALALKIIVTFWPRNAQECDTWRVTCGKKGRKNRYDSRSLSVFIRVDPWLNFVQKKIKKNVDARLAFWQIGVTHGNNRTTTQNKMRTKTLLLSAAALLAAGITTSQAQVYSQNIVGYATIPTPQANVNYLLNVPFAIGVSNGANEIWGTSLPDQTKVLVWSVNHYNTFTWAPGDYAPPNSWEDASQNNVPAPVLPVGQGFFLIPGGANLTNTFAGTVAVNVGTSNIMALTNANVNYLVGSVVPYAGAITNGNNSTGGPNLNGLPDQTKVLVWNVNHYDTFTWAPGDYAPPNSWEDASQNNVPPPNITVGQGFFIIPGGSGYKWTTGL